MPDFLPRAVIFDWDNTLTDTRTTIAAALNATRRAFGLQEWTLEDIRQNSARASRESFPEWFGDKWPLARDYFYKQIQAIHLQTVEPMPGADKLVRWLYAQKFPLFVVSNKRGDLLRAEAEALGWRDFFGRLVGSTDARHDKPSRDPVILALKQSNFVPDDPAIWFIGDSETDMETARNAGCTAVFLGDRTEGELFKADRTFSDCHALYEWFYNALK
jgi:phosphoglycolate phosphatase